MLLGRVMARRGGRPAGLASSSRSLRTQGELIQMWREKEGEHAWLEDVDSEEALTWVKKPTGML